MCAPLSDAAQHFFWRAMNPAYTLNLNYARIVFKLFCVHKETYLRLALHTEIGI